MENLGYGWESWNPVTGCTKISEACRNCYAEEMAKRFQEMGVERYRNGFAVTLHPDYIDRPAKWKRPRLVFVNSMSDLFHEDVPFDFLDEVYETMEKRAPQHIYQILTKRPNRMLEYYRSRKIEKPLENLMLGVTAETQKWADVRIPILLEVPARWRWINCEPLLDFIYMEKYLKTGKIHWVCAGGETARNFRITKRNWVVALANQCKKYNVPFRFSGWSARTRKESEASKPEGVWDEYPEFFSVWRAEKT